MYSLGQSGHIQSDFGGGVGLDFLEVGRLVLQSHSVDSFEAVLGLDLFAAN